MTKTISTFTAQVPIRQARLAMPGELAIGHARLAIGTQSTAEAASYGREARRYAARWSRHATTGRGYIEIRPNSKLTSEIVVALEAPRGLVGRLLRPAVQRLTALFARALRYEIETRATEEADGFDVRRTTAELVRARSA
jgi:hypothetical protein